MAQSSEDELYQRADNLLRAATHHFQSLFLQGWENLTQTKWNGKDSAQELVAMPGFKLIKKRQQSQLKKGVVEEWDITLLSELLIHFNADQKDEEDQAIRSIRSVRNKLAHNGRNKLNFKDYSLIEGEVKTNLVILGMKEEAAQNIIDQAEATSLNSVLEQFNKLQAEGDDFFSKNDYDKAILKYSDAMLLPNLPPGYLSILHEKRSTCHISKSKENINLKVSQLDLAFTDAEKAIKLNNDSWKGHHLLGLIYQERSKPEEALVYYRRAIAISPGQVEVRSDMDACTFLAGTFAREVNLDPHLMPISLAERVKEYNDETNSNISEEEFLEKMKRERKRPGQDHATTGEQYFRGWGVPQNYSEAAKHFSKATTFGNVQGIYCLAALYREGLGVKCNIDYAVELFLEAANNPNGRDHFVLLAQHAVGLLYEDGVGVPKDFAKAAYWYKKAADNNCGGAAHNLAIFYFWGKGIPLNEKKAVMYWKIGVEGKRIRSAHALHAYYLQRMEPELARSYFDLSIELGNDRLKSSRAQVFEEIDKMEKGRLELESNVKAFEEANKLSIEGLTFYERMKREMSRRSPEMANIVEDMDKLNFNLNTIATPEMWGESKMVDVNELLWKAEEGSKTAQTLLQSMDSNVRFIQMWRQRSPRDLVEEELEELLSTLCRCVTTKAYLAMIPQEMRSDVLQFLNELFHKFGGEKSRLDMQLRLCIFHLQVGVGGYDELHTELIVEALQRYPDEIPLYKTLSCAYVNLKEYRKGLEVCRKGLLKEPNDPDLLFSKAAHFRLARGKSQKKIRETYKEFCEKAPKDHPDLPGAYYCIAYSYILERKPRSKEVDEMVGYYYGLGEEAEKLQLSCYLPCDFTAKLVLKNFIIQTQNEKNSIRDDTGMSGNAGGSEEKVYLKDPKRIEIIKRHRKMAERTRNGEENENNFFASVKPKLTPKIPKSFNKLKAIRLHEMNSTRDYFYKGRKLNLTVIEGPFFGLPSLPLVVEDDQGEVTFLAIYNVEQNEQAKETFGVGAKFSIMNPYMSIGLDMTNGIRVDGPKCLVHMEGVKDMCRYCGRQGAKHTCTKCKKANYCGKDCEKMDCKVLKHKLICV